MNKPLKDWTLEEVITHCSKDSVSCESCRLDQLCSRYFICAGHIPKQWEIVEVPAPKVETIVWHKYPEDKPEADKPVLVMSERGDVGTVTFDEQCEVKSIFAVYENLVAWAEVPKGFEGVEE